MINLSRSSVKFGSIKPEDHKRVSLRSRIMPTPLPEYLNISLQQHQGTASTPRVKVGERVLQYQRIADATDSSSLPIHAPASGIIESIEHAILLHCDKRQEAIELTPIWDYRTLGQPELVSKLEEAGLCGMGGAGFPTARKLRSATESGVSTLIINAAECEPFLSCDEALIRERAEQVLQGAEILQACCQAERCVICIESSKEEAIASLEANLSSDSISLKIISPRYPAGDESQLVYAVTGKEAPESGLPIDVGAVVINAGTAAAAYQAVALGKPCVNRITTLTGSSLQTPKNFDVPIGTPVSHLLRLCGVNPKTHEQTIHGGSLMGQLIDAESTYIKKTSHCIIAATENEFATPGDTLPCIRCGFCANACPSHLLPQQLLHYAKQQDFESLLDHGLSDCIECGACAHVCPSKIPLVHYYRASKEAIAIQQHDRALGAQWQSRFQYVQYRKKRTTEEKSVKTIAGTKPETVSSSGNDSDISNESFSRERARTEIAAAVSRVKQKKSESKS